MIPRTAPEPPAPELVAVDDEADAPAATPGVRFWAGLVVLYCGVSLLIQLLSGVYRAELSHLPDETAHVMTSLLIHDYAVSGFHQTPRAYAENYYLHYPKVAFGMWPPFFHACTAAGLLLLGPARASVLVVIAVQSALFGLLLAIAVSRLSRPAFGAAAGLLLLLVPQVLLATTSVMLDTWVAVLELAALFWIVDYFRTARFGSAAAFGLFAGMAMSTKGNGNAIVLVPIFLLLLTRRFALLRRPGLYVSAVLSLGLGLPWQWISWRLLRTSVPISRMDAPRVLHLAAGYGGILVHDLGIPVCAAAVLGLAAGCSGLLRRRWQEWTAADFLRAGLLGLLLAVFLFHCAVPIPGPEARYMLPAFAALLAFGVEGVRWVAARPALARQSALIPAVLAVPLLVPAALAFSIPARPALGFQEIAGGLAEPKAGPTAILVCSDALGEGALTSEIAFHDRRPGNIILRATKVMSMSPWDGMSYQPLTASPSELESYLESVPVDVVVVDLTAAAWPQDRAILLQTMEQFPARWPRVGEWTASGARHLLIYRRAGSETDLRPKKVLLHMPFTLHKDLQLHP